MKYAGVRGEDTKQASLTSVSETRSFQWRGRAEQIPVPIDIVNAIDAWPVFGFDRSAHGVDTLCFGVWPLPVVIKQIFNGMRRILQRVIFSIDLARLNLSDFLSNFDHGLINLSSSLSIHSL